VPTTLFERLAERVAKWRADSYACEDHPAIAEMLEWAGETEVGELRFLRRPQVRALETYWYLRLVAGTPHVFDLYDDLFDGLPDRLDALDVSTAAFREAGYEEPNLWDRVRTDDEFVKRYKLEALRETLTLDYPSYILALAMGAGKTILIGAIIATEFAMAQEYPDGPFVQNALVFAPGKTIIESLRELNDVPYDRILPARMTKTFAASVKLTFTRDGEKDVPVVPGSLFNVVVTNTEKIRIQKETIRRADIGRLLDQQRIEDARAEVANARLTKIASLPHLAVFSDEAHHTYGQPLQKGLKRVRQTVDYLAENTNVVCVVNTTGTPYFNRQPLRDVVVWYGLSDGIRDGILKDVAGNIHSYQGDPEDYAALAVRDFFAEYGQVALPDGARAKLAMYFPQTDDLRRLRPAIDQALVGVGLSPASALVNTSDTSMTKQADIDAFNRLNDPRSPHRVVLLVNKGTEGWNCPSLFGCALIRRLKSSNNFVLQAASRCLRQVPGNERPARIYLSSDNYGILDRQLVETYGETLADLNRQPTERKTARLVVKKRDIPPLLVTTVDRFVVRNDDEIGALSLTRPEAVAAGIEERIYTLAEQHVGRRVLRQLEDTITIELEPDSIDVYAAASELAAQYRLDLWVVYDELRRLYGLDDVPIAHLMDLADQVETQVSAYSTHEEFTERGLALVKLDGFRQSASEGGEVAYTTEIVYPKDRENYLLSLSDLQAGGFGFHYDPYNFDSRPEKSFFEQMLDQIKVRPAEVEDIYFTGGITDPNKTDFFVEYRDDSGKWRRYTPDFVVRLKPATGGAPGGGKVLIVEIKSERDRSHAVNGENGAKAAAVRRWEELNPDRITYEMIFVAERDGTIPFDALEAARAFIGTTTPANGSKLRIHVDRARIEAFCKKWMITEFAFFGSVLRDDFRPDSDVDVLVRFAPDAKIGWNIIDAQDELQEIFGRDVDLVERPAVEASENYIRRKRILSSAETFYVAG
jgi:type III restriction enzyme